MYLCAAILLSGSALIAVRMKSLWSGAWVPAQETSAPPHAWLLGRDVWIAAQRTLPLGCPILATLAVCGLAVDTGHMTLYWASMGALIPLLICHASVVLYNRPSCVVIPRHRDEPGVVEVRATGVPVRRVRQRLPSRRDVGHH